jgi:hypothetical protein
MESRGTAMGTRALVRTALVVIDVGVALAGALGVLTAVSLGLASLGVAAYGVSCGLGLGILDFFPRFPVAARILTGLSLLAFAALLFLSALLLAGVLRRLWRGFRGWHGSVWAAGSAEAGGTPDNAAAPARRAARTSGILRLTARVSVAFAVLLTAAVTVMMILARGPFWHVWGWFV